MALFEAQNLRKRFGARVVLENISLSIEEGSVPLDAASHRALLRATIEQTTVAECLEALRALWKGGEASLVLTGPVDLERDQ